MNTIAERVHKVIAEQTGVPVDQVTNEKTMDGDLRMDSLDRFELSLQLEDEFGIQITDEESAPLSTVGEVVALVERKVSL